MKSMPSETALGSSALSDLSSLLSQLLVIADGVGR